MNQQASKKDTFPKLLQENCQLWGRKRVALRKKEYGIWREYTWQDCYDKTKAICLGLMAAGLQPKDGVCILGQSRPEWLWSELAVQTVGGLVLGPDANQSMEQTKSLLVHFRPAFAICQDQEQVDKVLGIRKDVPSLRKVVYWQEKGLENYGNPDLISLDDVVRSGQEHERNHPADFERALENGTDDDTAIVLLSSRAQGSLDLSPATHRFLLSCSGVIQVTKGYHRRKNAEYVSMACPGSFLEQCLGFVPLLLGDQKVNFVEGAATAMRDFREITPDVIVLPSSVWNGMASTIQAKGSDATWLKRRLFNYGLSAARRAGSHPPHQGQAGSGQGEYRVCVRRRVVRGDRRALMRHRRQTGAGLRLIQGRRGEDEPGQ
jgi:long-chain acyl-CoA synthetase